MTNSNKRYFVSYSHSSGNGFLFITESDEIRGFASDAQKMGIVARKIEDAGRHKDVVILFFKEVGSV